MSDAKTVDTDASCSIGGHPFSYSGTWSGYDVPRSAVSAGDFIAVESHWTVPHVATNSNYTYDDCFGDTKTIAPLVAAWDGMGEDYIIQSGTASCSAAHSQYRFWDEDYPYNPIFEGPSVTAGDDAFTSNYYEGSNKCQYFLENETTGVYQSKTHDCPDVGSHTADFILERSLGKYLPTFPTTEFDDNSFADSSTAWQLTNSNGNSWTMTDNCQSYGSVLAYPSTVSSHTFSVYHVQDTPVCNS